MTVVTVTANNKFTSFAVELYHGHHYKGSQNGM